MPAGTPLEWTLLERARRPYSTVTLHSFIPHPPSERRGASEVDWATCKLPLRLCIALSLHVVGPGEACTKVCNVVTWH